MKDPIIAEVRRVRRMISLMDPKLLAADLDSIRKRYKHRLINFPAKRLPRLRSSESVKRPV